MQYRLSQAASAHPEYKLAHVKLTVESKTTYGSTIRL